jgi:signal transduction histidine kinase
MRWSAVRRWLEHTRSLLSEPGDPAADSETFPLWRQGANLVTAHPLAVDAVIAGSLLAIGGAWLHRHNSGAGGWVLQTVLLVPLVWRRRYPVGVFCIMAVVALVQWSIGIELLADLGLLVALYSVAAYRARPVALGAAGVVEIGAVLASARWALTGSWVRSLVFLSGLIAAALLLGTTHRAGQAHIATLEERADRLEHERDQQAQIATAAERTRIAREMHDVIAHSLAVMISLADGAVAKLRTDPGRAEGAIRNVADLGRQALGDTRRLLGVLRTSDTGDELAPQPGFAQLPDLLEQVRATGIDATLTTEGARRELAAGAELTVFRIVQEATTNTIKHARGATGVAETVRYGSEGVDVTIADDGSAQNRPERLGDNAPNGSGHGLSGMSERASIYGGTVSAGPTPTGWTVKARLPIQTAAGAA